MAGATAFNELYLEPNSGWRVWEDPPTPRHALYQKLCSILKPLASYDIQRIMEQLRSQVRPRTVCSARRLSFAEVETLHARGLVRIGSHTVTHPMLSTLSVAAQMQEIVAARTSLENLLDARVDHFAYPYGDYSGETLEIVRTAGIEIACSTKVGNTRTAADRWELPRHNVFDLGAAEFSNWMWRIWNAT
jgi:peptidoglycan/xylan/chitin deacetylase (PgdA/CDA1 family)